MGRRPKPSTKTAYLLKTCMSGLAESRHRTEPLTAARLGGYWPIMAEPPRRFPAPWRADKVPGGYVVRDATGQALAYLYGRETEADARQARTSRTLSCPRRSWA
jgi:hypothetical protein